MIIWSGHGKIAEYNFVGLYYYGHHILAWPLQFTIPLRVSIRDVAISHFTISRSIISPPIYRHM